MEKQNDLISRAALLAEYDRVHVGPPGGARKLMENAPSVNAEPVRHGYVIVHEGREDDYWEQCSVCGSKEANKDANYCPNCGAKMDGGQ